jgi:hypothetical protein
MVFQLKDPLDETTRRRVTRERISHAEFISATYDSTYGHDFNKAKGLTKVYELGKLVLDNVRTHYNSNAQTGSETMIPHKSIVKDESNLQHMEESCIVEVLRKNKMGTITQRSNMYICSLNPQLNYITGEFFLPAYNKPWNLFMCPLSFSPAISVIDFTSGVQPYQQFKVEIMNFFLNEMYGIKNPSQHSTFRITAPNALSNYMETNIQKLNQKKQFIEVFLPTSEYDEAARYGLIPSSVTGNYDTCVNVGDNIWFIARTHSETARNMSTVVQNRLGIVGGEIMTPLSYVLSILTEDERSKLTANDEFIGEFDWIWRQPGLKLTDNLTLEQYYNLLSGFKGLNPYKKQGTFYTRFQASNNEILMNPTDISPTAQPRDARKENFDMLMLSILRFIINDSIRPELKTELLTIFEKVVKYADTEEPSYLGIEVAVIKKRDRGAVKQDPRQDQRQNPTKVDRSPIKFDEIPEMRNQMPALKQQGQDVKPKVAATAPFDRKRLPQYHGSPVKANIANFASPSPNKTKRKDVKPTPTKTSPITAKLLGTASPSPNTKKNNGKPSPNKTFKRSPIISGINIDMLGKVIASKGIQDRDQQKEIITHYMNWKRGNGLYPQPLTPFLEDIDTTYAMFASISQIKFAATPTFTEQLSKVRIDRETAPIITEHVGKARTGLSPIRETTPMDYSSPPPTNVVKQGVTTPSTTFGFKQNVFQLPLSTPPKQVNLSPATTFKLNPFPPQPPNVGKQGGPSGSAFGVTSSASAQKK